MHVTQWRNQSPAHLARDRARLRLYARKRRGIVNPTDEIRQGQCPICLKTALLVMDHQHETGEFRGWICRGCNTYEGWYSARERNGDNERLKIYLNTL